MKLFPLSIFAIATISQLVAMENESKRAVDSMKQKASAGDIRGLIDSLPNLENLWKEDPVSYMEALRINLRALIASGTPEAKNAALSAFPNLIAKSCPADTASATIYIRNKFTTVSNYFNFNEVRADKERLLMVADFLSEVRSLRIPDYQNQGTNLPGREILAEAGVREAADLPTQAQKNAYSAAVKKNEDDAKMNELQTALSSADYGLTSTLVTYGKGFSVKDPANREFYQELAERAKLTEEEIKTLHTQVKKYKSDPNHPDRTTLSYSATAMKLILLHDAGIFLNLAKEKGVEQDRVIEAFTPAGKSRQLLLEKLAGK